MRSKPERLLAHHLGDYEYEPYKLLYTSTYTPDFSVMVKNVEVVIECKSTANAAVRKQLREVHSSLRHGRNFIVCVYIPSRRFRISPSELAEVKYKTAGTIAGLKLIKWLDDHGIRWLEYNEHLQVTEERLYAVITRSAVGNNVAAPTLVHKSGDEP